MIPRYSRPEMAALWTDQAKYERWLQVEVAAVRAWVPEGRVPPADADVIAERASFVLADIDRYQAETHHDVTAFLRSVTDSLGEEGRWVHLGLTSSDVWDTATSLQLRDAASLLETGMERLEGALVAKAREHKETLMVGRTHGIHAEPLTFGLVLALWVDEVRRGRTRLAAAKAGIAVGKISGAVGTHATVPPVAEERICAALGLGVAPVSNQVLQRDRHAEFVSTLALIGASLEKFAVEIRHMQRTELREAEEPFLPGQTGSSSMPHKRNPEKCERVSGLARVLRGYATTALENVALWHERDISHSSTERIVLPDSCLLLDYMLDMFSWIIENLVVYPERMRQNMERSFGLVYSQRVLLALVDGGMAREAAYTIVQSHGMTSWNEERSFLELLQGDERVVGRLGGEGLRECFDPGYYLRYVGASFERVGI
jgi:adenylosuccinate lyase